MRVRGGAPPVGALAIAFSLAAGGAIAAAEPGPRAHRVREVRFTGDLAFPPEVLADQLRALDRQRVVPGLWTRDPIYDARAVEADLARLQSLYLSHGYFDAEVGVAAVTVAEPGITVTFHVRAGPRSRVRQLRIEGDSHAPGSVARDAAGPFPADALCAGLLAARSRAEADGRLDFAAAVELTRVDHARNLVDVAAHVARGSPRRVGRIGFSGHRSVDESTLRRALALPEGALFDVEALRRGLSRVNASGLFEPLSLASVEIVLNPDGIGADLRIPLRERPRRGWRLSGALLPPALDSLQAAIAWRLPAWGRGVFQAATYVLTWNVLGLARHLLNGPAIASFSNPWSLLTLERPLLPGQALLSGFALSPGLPARAMLAHYGRTHAAHGIEVLLAREATDAMGVVVVDESRQETGADPHQSPRVLVCEPPRPRLGWLRQGALQAASLALAWMPF